MTAPLTLDAVRATWTSTVLRGYHQVNYLKAGLLGGWQGLGLWDLSFERTDDDLAYCLDFLQRQQATHYEAVKP